MRLFITIAFCILLPGLAGVQVVLTNIDSLRNAFMNAPDGRVKFAAANKVYYYYQELNRDSALFYTQQQVTLARRVNNKIAEGVALVSESYQLMGLGRYADALKCLQQAFVIAEDEQNEKQEGWDYFFTPFEGNNRLLLLSYTHHMYALLMLNTENLEQQIIHFRIAGEIGKVIKYTPRVMLAYLNLGHSYLTKNVLDSALYYEKEAERVAISANEKTFTLSHVYLGTVEMHLGDIYHALGNDSMSLFYFHKSLGTTVKNNNRVSLSRVYYKLGKFYIRKANKDSSLYYARKNLDVLQTLGGISGRETNLGVAYEILSQGYKLNNEFDSAYKYQGQALVSKDSFTNIRVNNLADFQKLTYSEQLRLQNLEKEKIVYQNKVRTYFLLAGIGVLLLLAAVFYRNNRQKHKATIAIEKAYENLKATQQQLIQSEKMASLGELTAGIAHEIQNPLNFVNNFSEVNAELIEELVEEVDRGNTAEVKAIAKDIKENEEKINHHGKRADAIVKGMLQHSRSSNGQKEPTNINALADEYVRLAYHGLRAKDKSFNATLKTEYDESVGNIDVIPQDIGRVLLNLVNNAFYAVDEKKKQGLDNYQPTVTVSTKKINDKIEIKVADNGNGIPQKVLDKIFQPFFTTKPTGQGTGLGLSLSYDIVKTHGGELKVETQVNDGSTFTLLLPAN